jgi:hypothetical protein
MEFTEGAFPPILPVLLHLLVLNYYYMEFTEEASLPYFPCTSSATLFTSSQLVLREVY